MFDSIQDIEHYYFMGKTQTLNTKEQAQCNAPVGHCTVCFIYSSLPCMTRWQALAVLLKEIFFDKRHTFLW